jgi:hypothetical protein
MKIMKTRSMMSVARTAQLFVCALLCTWQSTGQPVTNCVYTAGQAQSLKFCSAGLVSDAGEPGGGAPGNSFKNRDKCPSPGSTSLSGKRVPLSFIENKGQVTDQNHNPRTDIAFRMNAANGLNIFIGSCAIHYQFSKTEQPAATIPGKADMTATPRTYDMYRMDVELLGANKHAKIITEQKQDYYEHCRFTTGNGSVRDAAAHTYSKITYKDVYPHIDWVLYVSNGQLKHEFVIRPGGQVANIQLKYAGATDLKINTGGDLMANTPQGAITEHAPRTYQKQDGRIINSSFKLNDDVLSYETGSYNGELIIDPALAWATYYGGSDPDEGIGITTDKYGNVYMTGRTYSTSGIATSGAHQTIFGGYADAFLVKFNSAGVRQWATYYGGDNYDVGYGVAADAYGNVYMAGEAWSTSGIATPGAFQTTNGGNGNAFLVKFNSAGVRQWGTYFGATGASGAGVATDDWGNVYMTGNATTAGIATPGAHQTTFGGFWDAFLVKFTSTGMQKWATYYGGSAPDYGKSVATDRWGNVYIAGVTASTAGIASHSAYMLHHGGGTYDMFLVKFNSAGVRKWGTYYGGSGDDQGHAVATDDCGNVYIAGISTTAGLATCGAYETTYKGTGYNGLLVKFSTDGWRQWATYYGGNGAWCSSVATDGSGNVYLTGATYDTVGVATPGAHQTAWAGGFDAFLVKFTSWGSRQWGTYYGGINDEMGQGVATDLAGNAYITGIANSLTGIATPGAHQVTKGGISDAFVAKFGAPCPVAHHGWGHKEANTGSLNEPTDEVGVYPNPSTGAFTVEIPAGIADATITVMDVNGRIVANTSVTASDDMQKVQFNLNRISTGIHFIQVISGDNRYMTKVLVQ